MYYLNNIGMFVTSTRSVMTSLEDSSWLIEFAVRTIIFPGKTTVIEGSFATALLANIVRTNYSGLHSIGIFLNTIQMLIYSDTHRLPTAVPTCDEMAKYPNQSSWRSLLITAIATRANVNKPTMAIQAAVWNMGAKQNSWYTWKYAFIEYACITFICYHYLSCLSHYFWTGLWIELFLGQDSLIIMIIHMNFKLPF